MSIAMVNVFVNILCTQEIFYNKDNTLLYSGDLLLSLGKSTTEEYRRNINEQGHFFAG